MIDLTFQILDPIISQALKEDVGLADITTRAIVTRHLKANGEFLAKEDFVLAGWLVVVRTFQLSCPDAVVDGRCHEGDNVSAGSVLGSVHGAAGPLLSAERVALNFLQRVSGVATLTRQFVKAVSGTKAAILDTRKTTPGLRVLEKYAVRVGGGKNHRFGLFDGVLIKENHIAVAGGIPEAVRRARAGTDHLKKIEVEVTNIDELEQALKAGADVVLLDNMSPSQVKTAVQRAAGKVQLEVSGGINLENVLEYAQAGVDFISVGALTHSYKAADISLELKV
jgi:nicotinate-nucleotide pyrophosphorylase (carboxylating)